MSFYPHTRLHIGSTSTIVVSGPYIELVQNGTGAIEATVDDPVTIKSGPIRCSAVDSTWRYLVTAAEDKKLRVWDLQKGLKMLSERELPKKPTEILIPQDSQSILVSDKFGDVFSYLMIPDPTNPTTSEPAPSKSGRTALTSHENLAGGTLILGHTSLLTSFVLSKDEKYIISADRDEHIRVSWYPQGFVSAIHIPTFSPHTLISGGGDPYIQCWDWLTGAKGKTIHVLDNVVSYIKVRPVKGRTSSWEGEDGGEAGSDEKKLVKKGRGKRKKGKGKAEEAAVEADVDGVEEVEDVADAEGTADAEGVADSEDVVMGEPSCSTLDQATPDQARDDSPTLVVHRIRAVQLPDGSKWIVFSVVGAVALFYIRHPEDWQGSEAPSILVLILGKPVIDFLTIEADEKLWVLTDAAWVDSDATLDPSTSEERKDGVRVGGWTQTESGWKLAELSNASSPFLTSLNSTCLKSGNLVSILSPLRSSLVILFTVATSADLKTADIYAHLSSMPKNVDPEHDPIVRDDIAALLNSTDADTTDATSVTDQGKKELTQRELARLKNKKALVESIREREAGKESVEREAKKIRTDTEEQS
ncbi:hypothetical protein EUX98_g6388 [Antrodiella citrinella]|uniref:Uncharacterized protein n=1 Tax=Antrodiella citrinella TaxID=2447956 RepID=A0A4S4MWK8_9APHY|nr:hypothetical protein EUX98_g6388 [Antrodiella citrinella]